MCDLKMYNGIYDWDFFKENNFFSGIVDETIRDGLQCIKCPIVSTQDKKEIIKKAEKINCISDMIIGMVGIDAKSDNEILEVAQELGHINGWVLCRLKTDDIKRVIEINKKLKNKLNINLYIAVSDIRLLIEKWDFVKLLKSLEECIKLAKKEFSLVRVAIEDATRSTPNKLEKVLKLLISYDVDRIVIADTVGIATPVMVERIFSFIRCNYDIKEIHSRFEWHGHNDRGLAVANALVAIREGANYVHATMIGIGERNGNTALEVFLCNMYEQLGDKENWNALQAYYTYCLKKFGETLKKNYPYFGENCNKSSTGTHGAAVYKAIKMNRKDLALSVFSIPSPYKNSVDDMIYVSKISGEKNYKLILEDSKIKYSEKMIKQLIKYIKENNLYLSKSELISILDLIKNE